MVLFLVLLVLFTDSALALGISPAQRTVHDGGVPQELSFRVILAPGEQGTLEARVEGDLAPHIEAEIEDGDGAPELVVRIAQLPDLAPGAHEQRVILALVPDETQGQFSARTEVAALLTVVVPAQGAYLRAHWDAASDTGAGPGGDVRVTVSLENLGTLPVTPDGIVLSLSDATAHDTLALAPVEVPAGGAVRVDGRYALSREGSLAPGDYDATLTVRYAGKEIVERKPIALGAPALSVSSLSLEREAGGIWPVRIEGALAWNAPLEVRATLFTDDAQAPAIEERFVAQGPFSRTLYLDTQAAGVPARDVRVMLEAREASAQALVRVQGVPGPAEDGVAARWVPLVAAACALVLVLAGLLWLRARRKAPPQGGEGDEQGQAI